MTRLQATAWRKGLGASVRAAEHEKLLAHIDVLEQRIRRFAESVDAPQGPALDAVNRLLNSSTPAGGASGEPLHAHANQLEELLPLIADVPYLVSVLTAELAPSKGGETIRLPDMVDNTLLKSLSHTLTNSWTEPPEGLQRNILAQILSQLSRARSDEHRHERLMAAIRSFYLRMLAAAGFFCVAALIGLGLVDHPEAYEQMLIALAAGGLGGSISAVFKVRDVVELTPLKSVATVALFQPLIGSLLGLVSWFILSSQLLSIAGFKGDSLAGIGTLALAVGFSEPFFLNLVGRVTGTVANSPRPDHRPAGDIA